MLEAFRVRTRVSPSGSVTLEGLPFPPGADVEAIVIAEERSGETGARYPLRGTPYRLVDPTSPVAFDHEAPAPTGDA